MAKKSVKRKNANPAAAKLPAGFTATAVSGDFAAWHDFEKSPILTGKVVASGSYEGEYGKQRTLTVQAGKVASAISESKGLKGLFDTKGIVGKIVYIKYLGTIEVGKPNKKGKRKTFKQFAAGVK